MTTTDSAQQDGFLELLLRVPNSERKRLLFAWSALSEMGAAPKVYLEAARRIAPRTAAVADFPPASELGELTEDESLGQQLADLLGRLRIGTDEWRREGSASYAFEEAIRSSIKRVPVRTRSIHCFWALPRLPRTSAAARRWLSWSGESSSQCGGIRQAFRVF